MLKPPLPSRIKTAKKTVSTGYAREAPTKRGMDESQITGTASSYARKYALNGLFLIDDTKDADTPEYQSNTQQQRPANRNPQQGYAGQRRQQQQAPQNRGYQQHNYQQRNYQQGGNR